MSENLPVPVRPEVPAMGRDLLTNLGEIERVAIACAASGYYNDVRDASQAVVKMLAGREMGIGPIQSLAGIHIVEGKPTAGANVIAANVKRSGRYNYHVKSRTNTECVLEWFENGQSVGESSFTEADAKLAGLAGKNNWKKYPRAMYFARALTEGVRVFCPDAGAGVIYTPEELAPDIEVTESGDVVNGVIVEPTTPRQPPAQDTAGSSTGAPQAASKPKSQAARAPREQDTSPLSEGRVKLCWARLYAKMRDLGHEANDENKHAARDIVLGPFEARDFSEVRTCDLDTVLQAIEEME